MDLLFQHQQSKTLNSNKSHSECDLRLYEFNHLIHYIAKFSFDFHRQNVKHRLIVDHGFTINLKSGDIDCNYRLNIEVPEESKITENKTKRSKNNFNRLFSQIESGFYKGEKRNGYWGVRYEKSLNKILTILIEKIQPTIQNQHYKKYDYINDSKTNPLFDLLVNFHLDKKNIKGHDSVYRTIITEYPKQKWLKNNENKFLSAILDSYGIKSKYLIGEINQNVDHNIEIKTLNYFCKLFGENHITYLKQINWVKHCLISVPNKKIHKLKNEHEKKCMVSLINCWGSSSEVESNLVDVINELLSIREFIESKDIKLKFNPKNVEQFQQLLEEWSNLKNHFKRGYRVRYSFPEYFLYEVESDIKVKDRTFEVYILKTEEDFNIEGYVMKNCMSKEFKHGIFSIYVSLTHKKMRINLQYKNGNLIQVYGKANSAPDPIFEPAIQVLNSRMSENCKIGWTKEKFDFIDINK